MIVVGDDDMNGNLKEKTEQFLRVNLCHVLKVVRSLVVVPFSAIYYYTVWGYLVTGVLGMKLIESTYLSDRLSITNIVIYRKLIHPHSLVRPTALIPSSLSSPLTTSQPS